MSPRQPRPAESLTGAEAALIMAHQIDPFCVHHLADTECLEAEQLSSSYVGVSPENGT